MLAREGGRWLERMMQVGHLAGGPCKVGSTAGGAWLLLRPAPPEEGGGHGHAISGLKVAIVPAASPSPVKATAPAESLPDPIGVH